MMQRQRYARLQYGVLPLKNGTDATNSSPCQVTLVWTLTTQAAFCLAATVRTVGIVNVNLIHNSLMG
jgi:hypothetical protein